MGRNTMPQTDDPHIKRVSHWAIDLSVLVLFGILWIHYVTPVVVTEQRRGGDVARDVASAVNIQHGRIFGDPAYRDHTIWYPPLSPLIFAGISTALGVSPFDCYRWSELVFNWLIPAGLYLVVRLGWGWRAAAGTLIALLLAMPWWQVEVVQGQPSIHAVVLGWVALLLYAQQRRRACLGWAAACGVVQGVAFWQHPVIPAILTVTFVVDVWWSRREAPAATAGETKPAHLLSRDATILILTLVIAAPILYLMLHGPVRNTVPREYVAAELSTGEFALMHANPWIWLMGLVGLIVSIRRWTPPARLLVIAPAVCVLGQLPAYRHLYGPAWMKTLPVLVPHEFQRAFQLGWAVCVGVGIDATLRELSLRTIAFRGRAGGALLPLAAFVATAYPGALHVRENLRRYVKPASLPPVIAEAVDWINANTDVNDVFACQPEWAFEWLNPRTGRKVWISAKGHSNPRVDWRAREQVMQQLRDAASADEFWRIAHEHGIDYCVLSPSWYPRVFADPRLWQAASPNLLQMVHGGGGKVIILQVNSRPQFATGTVLP